MWARAIQQARLSLHRKSALGRLLNNHAREKGIGERVRLAQMRFHGGLHFVRLRKIGDELTIGFDCMTALRDFGLASVFAHRLRPLIYLASLIDRDLVAFADISDGHEQAPDFISFCSRDDLSILVPDSDFYAARGYDPFRVVARSGNANWVDRDDAIVWRGSTTGQGKIASSDMRPGDESLLQRTRMCLLLHDEPGVNVRFHKVVQSQDPKFDERRLGDAGLLGGYITPFAWRTQKFGLDCDGNSNTWSNLFIKLLFGCCVIKIGSRFGYRQWYYDDLHAWEHYVPVAADLTDLREKVAWCRSHDRECAEIAERGQAFAMGMTFDGEMRKAAQRIATRLQA